jgi:hypothetical protein
VPFSRLRSPSIRPGSLLCSVRSLESTARNHASSALASLRALRCSGASEEDEQEAFAAAKDDLGDHAAAPPYLPERHGQRLAFVKEREDEGCQQMHTSLAARSQSVSGTQDRQSFFEKAPDGVLLESRSSIQRPGDTRARRLTARARRRPATAVHGSPICDSRHAADPRARPAP